jgi:hypothetical protein
MNAPTEAQIQKLPKWAQEHISTLEMNLRNASSTMLRMRDEQTVSPIYVDDWYSTPRIKRYIQSPAGRVTLQHAGVKVEIFLPSENDGQRLFGPEIQYEGIQKSLSWNPVAIMPRGIGTIQLVHKDNI